LYTILTRVTIRLQMPFRIIILPVGLLFFHLTIHVFMKTKILATRLPYIRGMTLAFLLSSLVLLAYSGCCPSDENKKHSFDTQFNSQLKFIIRDSATQEPIISPFHDFKDPKFFDKDEVTISSSSGTSMTFDSNYMTNLAGEFTITRAFDINNDFKGDNNVRTKAFWIFFEDKYNRDIDTLTIKYFTQPVKHCQYIETHLDSVQFFFNKKLVYRRNDCCYDKIFIDKP
jgi:hypothetical protein